MHNESHQQPVEHSRKAEIVRETAKIPWRELQKFFASGATVYVSPELDLVEVACQISLDNKPLIENLMAERKLAPVSDQQAIEWLDADITVWSVVIKPWVLVQPGKPE